MAKIIVPMEKIPKTCLDCPFRYESEKIPLGNFTYQSLFRCKFEPEDLYKDLDKDVDVYLTDIRNTKPDWCPLEELIHCRDCVYFDENQCYCNRPYESIVCRDPDDFCSKALRRTLYAKSTN